MKLDTICNKAEVTTEINKNDEFYTPKYAIEPILNFLKKDDVVWCPFDTEESNYVKMIKDQGVKVVYTHISTGGDFFKSSLPEGVTLIISNPPYSLKTEVFERLFSLNIPFAMLVGIVGLFESKKRFEMFKNNEFEIMYFDKRISYFKSYSSQKTDLNPPFSSVYITKGLLPEKIMFVKLKK